MKTSNPQDFKPFLDTLILPSEESHKGQNGKGLIIGGSTLFHAASLWAAEISSHFLDMVHYSSTEENLEIFTNLKTKFRNGIIVHKKDIPFYVKEDDVILVGPGMVRDEVKSEELRVKSFEELLQIEDEAEYSRQLTYYLLKNFPDKKFVFDAGALQMMEKDWLKLLQIKPILTPHQGEFERLFGKNVSELSIEEKAEIVKQFAKEYNCVILLKAITDIISDGERTILIEGGNQGLTKGGSGDVLAGLTASLYATNEAVTSAVIASFLIKRAADELKLEDGYWYNIINLIEKIPVVLTKLLSGRI
ncbi:MAG TPA: NAD(P)H-hydrate dehydratase [Candidatus Woesebacteria bacterium]|nr:NAD(P)H-hydrate dehydratase [Candidatus Woesebacteria bacterium]